MKRVITGERDGKSFFAHVGEVDAVASHGFQMRLMWGEDTQPQSCPRAPRRLPMTVTSSRHPQRRPHDADPLPARREATDAAGGALDDVMTEGHGMHQTVSMDIGWVISGELGIQLDSGATVWLEPGDLIVQNGTRHQWINRTDQPAVAGFVTLGATRESI